MSDSDDDDFYSQSQSRNPQRSNNKRSQSQSQTQTVSDCDDSDDFCKSSQSQNLQRATVALKRNQRQASSQPQGIRAVKKAAKEAAAAEKNERDQVLGKSREKEIGLVLHSDCDFIPEIEKKFEQKVEKGVVYPIFTSTMCSVKGLFRWTHRKMTKGGAATVGVEHTEVFPYVVIEMSPADIVGYLDQSADGYEFTAWVDFISNVSKCLYNDEFCPERTRIVILVIAIDKYLSKLNRRPKVGIEPYSNMFDNASSVLLCECSVEVVSLQKKLDAADYIHGITRQLASEPYTREDTGLDVASRFSKKKRSVEDKSVAEQKQHLLHQTWVNMLQCIDGVTEASAKSIAGKYKSVKELVGALKDPTQSLEQRQLMLQDMFSGKGRKPKLSKLIFNVFGGDDENLVLNNEEDI